MRAKDWVIYHFGSHDTGLRRELDIVAQDTMMEKQNQSTDAEVITRKKEIIF